jgi:hypothetical protein
MFEPSPNASEAYALIIDTSSSAGPDLNEARKMAQRIYYMTGAEGFEQLKLFKIFMLGSTKLVSPATLDETPPPGVGGQPKPCSLIAPIMEALVREERKRRIIIIGNGEIFDLDDWIGDPRVHGWLLVKTGEQSLQKAGGRVSEISLGQVSDKIETLLSYFNRFTREALEPPRRNHDPDAYKWRVDASGYPLIFVEPLGTFVQLFPVTKPQFEKFLASGRRPDFGDEWYAERLSANPRASYWSTYIPERARLFMTGITPDEALAFGRWLGRDYSLLSAEDWSACYEWFAEQPVPSVPPDIAGRLSQDALGVWKTVEGQWLESHWEPSFRELSLMTQGILEWVVERSGRYCGLGEPASKFQRKANDPVRPVGQRRLKNLGFRLRMR